METLISNIKGQANVCFYTGINPTYVKANADSELEWKAKVIPLKDTIKLTSNSGDLTITKSNLQDESMTKFLKSINLL